MVKVLYTPNVNWYLASKLKMFINRRGQFDPCLRWVTDFIVDRLLDGTIYDSELGIRMLIQLLTEKFKKWQIEKKKNIRKLERTGLPMEDDSPLTMANTTSATPSLVAKCRQPVGGWRRKSCEPCLSS